MNRTEAVIFDMDGVIVDSEPHHKWAFLQVLDEIGYAKNHGIVFEDYLGRTDNELWVDFINKHQPKHTLAELLSKKRVHAVERLRRVRPLFDGLLDLVKSLHGKYKLAVASGSDRMVVDEVLKIENLGSYFQASITAVEAGRGKPFPDIFLKAAKLIDARPEECWVIEDTKAGIAAGLAAGMRVIAIPNTHPAEELTHATCLAHSYAEIGRIVAAGKTR